MVRRFTNVREVNDSPHRGNLIKGRPETPRTSRQYGIEGFLGDFNWAAILYFSSLGTNNDVYIVILFKI